MSEAYQYVFSPLVNVNLSEERCELGTASVRKVDGATLEKLWRWMEDNNSDARYWPYGETPAEVAFVVKEYTVVTEVEEHGVLTIDGHDSPLFEIRHKGELALDRDIFWRERVCLNLAFNAEIATPIAFCSDDFPSVAKGDQYWRAPDSNEDWLPGNPTGSQQIDESIASTIRDGMIRWLVGERLDERQWLKRALAAYDKASRLGRDPEDAFKNYWEVLEALFSAGSTGEITVKLATRVAMVLTDTDEEYTRVSERLKELYGMSSRKRHAAHEIDEEVVPKLRRCVRRSILMALELSKSVTSEQDWQSRCNKLLEVRDRDQIEELKQIRGRWSAVW